MIDLNDVKLIRSQYVDGQLDDGRLIEFKIAVPNNMDNLMHIIVAMANTKGGVIIFGVDGRNKSIVGLKGNCQRLIDKIDFTIKRYSVGVKYNWSNETINGKGVLVLEIDKSESTSYFSRLQTTPARQIAYVFKETNKGEIKIENIHEMRYSKVYKYMTLEAFLTSLYCRTWRFFEPSKWNDKFEQRFYCANYILPSAIGSTPQLFASCVTRQSNNEAAWKVYSHGQGLGVHCVQLELDVVQLRKQLRSVGCQFEER